MPNETAQLENAVGSSTKDKGYEVGLGNKSTDTFDLEAAKELYGAQEEEPTSLFERVHKEEPAKVEVAQVTETAGTKDDSQDEPSELVSMLKSDSIADGSADRFKWVTASASDAEIAAGVMERSKGDKAEWKEGNTTGHEYKAGDLVVVEQGGKKEVAYLVKDFRGRLKFNRQTEDGEVYQYSSLESAFPELKDGAVAKVFSPAGEATAQSEGGNAETKVETKPADTRVDASGAGDGNDAEVKDDTTPKESGESVLEGRVVKTDINSQVVQNTRQMVSERQELLTGGKAPTDTIEVKKGDQTVQMTVAERLKELEDGIRGTYELQLNAGPRLELLIPKEVDPVLDKINEGAEKLRVHDFVIQTAGNEIAEYQDQGKKPEDLTGRKIMKNGEMVDETVGDRVKELKTIIRDEIGRSFETAQKVSPGPIDRATTRELDVQAAKVTAERAELMQKLGIMDPRLVTPENLAKMRGDNPEQARDILRLQEVMEQGARIQDVRHGLSYTKLRSAEMKAIGYANPNVAINESTGTPNDVKDAFTDLTHARTIDSAVKRSQAGYQVEIIVASKVAPMLATMDQALKHVELEGKFEGLRKDFVEAGMNNQDRQDKELGQLKLAQEIDALMVLGNKEASNDDKETALKQLEELGAMDKDATNAQDVLAELNKAVKAGADYDLSAEEVALKLAAEKAQQLDLGFLNAESQRDFFRMRALDGTIIDPDDPNRRKATFADRFAMMRDVGARARLENAIMMQDNGFKNYESMKKLSRKYRGKDLAEALDASKGSEDHHVLSEIAKRYYGSDASKYEGVRLNAVLSRAQNEFDDATVDFIAIKTEAPHLIFKKVGDDIHYVDERMAKVNYKAQFGVTSVDPSEYADAQKKFLAKTLLSAKETDKALEVWSGKPASQLSDAEKKRYQDEIDNVDPRSMINNMYQVTELMERDAGRQEAKLQNEIKNLETEKAGLAQKEFTSEDAREMESQRIQLKIDELKRTIEVRNEAIKHQRNLARFYDANDLANNGQYSECRERLASIKRDDPKMYESKDFQMEELWKGADPSLWGSIKRNWKTIAGVATIVAGVAITAATVGVGSPLGAALVGAGASALTATAIGVGVAVVGTTASGALIYGTGGRLAEGEWKTEHFKEGAWEGAKVSAFTLAGFGVGTALRGATGLATAAEAGTSANMFVRGLNAVAVPTSNALAKINSYSFAGIRGGYWAAGTALQAPSTYSYYRDNWDNMDAEKAVMGVVQHAAGTMMYAWGTQFMSHGSAGLGKPGGLIDKGRGLLNAEIGGSLAANTGKTLLKIEAYNAVEDGFKWGINEVQQQTGWMNGDNVGTYDWLRDRSGNSPFRDQHTGPGGIRELLFRTATDTGFLPARRLDFKDLHDRNVYNFNLYDFGRQYGLTASKNDLIYHANGIRLPFMMEPSKPSVRAIYAPEISRTPMYEIQYFDGRMPSYVPMTDQTGKPGSSSLQFRLDGLNTGTSDPFKLRRER